MSYTTTDELELRKDGGDERLKDWRPHNNDNLDIIDEAIAHLNANNRGKQTWGNLAGTTTWGELKGTQIEGASGTTSNLELIKPGYDSSVDIDTFNDNMDILDTYLGNLAVFHDAGKYGSAVDLRRNIYRGKNLGTSLTNTQKESIADGSFYDMYIGDFWVRNGRIDRIADFEYWYNSGDTAFTKHHIVIVPDSSFGSGRMNATNVTTGGYIGSEMYTSSNSVLNTAKSTISSDYGSALATHRILLTNAVNNGYPSSGEWHNSTGELMNEPMVYGSYIFVPGSTGSIVPYRYTTEKTQLALFRLNPRMINPGRYTYWLRDVVSSAAFARVGTNGNADHGNASTSIGVRLAFPIVGD